MRIVNRFPQLDYSTPFVLLQLFCNQYKRTGHPLPPALHKGSQNLEKELRRNTKGWGQRTRHTAIMTS
ncbi:hypothetical protein ACFX13_046847 [Malus domestica]